MPERTSRICTVEELSEHGSSVIQEIEGTEIAVFNVHGEYHAILNYCPHQSGPLCEDRELSGFVGLAEDGWDYEYVDEGTTITCPWHNWKFDVTTGRSRHTDRYSVPTFDVEEVDGDLVVTL